MKIAIVGVGNLGSVMAKRLLASGVPRSDLSLFTRGSSSSVKRCEELGIEPSDRVALEDQDVIVLTVKPQDALETCGMLRSTISAKCAILSAMAGISCATLRESLAHDLIARVMPNLGAAVGESASVYFASEALSARNISHIESIISSFGQAWKVDNEGLLDLATAVAGSGPAYVCWLGECVERVARENGFSEREAHAIVLQTFRGAVAYLEQSGETFAMLRARVTSPNGTTAAATSVLEGAHVGEAIREAVRAAFNRSRELGAVRTQDTFSGTKCALKGS